MSAKGLDDGVDCRTILAFGLRLGLGPPLELFGEGLVVEENVGIVELAVPCALEVLHCGDQLVQFFVPDEGDERGVDARRALAVGGVIVVISAP